MTKQVRAAPRRRKEALSETTAVFVSKLYEMVNSSNENVCWTEDGCSFFIEEPDVFTSEIIPQYFKSQKFSSFVRQLNFYGFRAVSRSGLEFTHPSFVRGKPELLSEIKRSTHYGAERSVVVTLEKEVHGLKLQIGEMDERISNLTSMLESLMSGGGLPRKRQTCVKPEMEETVALSVADSCSSEILEDSELMRQDSLCSLPMDFPDVPCSLTDSMFLGSFDDVQDLEPEPQQPSHIVKGLSDRLDAMPASAQEKLAEGLVKLLPASQTPEIALPLASAALGAFLTHFARNRHAESSAAADAAFEAILEERIKVSSTASQV
jgi:hypothetical protein